MDKGLAKDSPNSLLSQTRRLLRQFDLRARKGLGQHFLIDSEVLEIILNTAELASTDTVIEVGPGLGILTGELAKQAGWVIAIELDNKLAAILKKTLALFDNVVSFIQLKRFLVGSLGGECIEYIGDGCNTARQRNL